jgi:5,5'-dehydrodivanillate O-demethylase
MSITQEENTRMTQVGPGTPAGNMLRRYWWPILPSDEVKNKPIKVGLLGEKFVLFRTGEGKLGLLDLNCTHRRASLEFGRVEDKGIRCCYHGWKYDVEGNVLDMMIETDNGAKIRQNYKQPSYDTFEISGMVFAYIGPKPAPKFPKWDLLFDDKCNKFIVGRDCHSNWVQRVENLNDPLHVSVLHAAVYPELAGARATTKDVEWHERWYGIDMRLTYASGIKDRHHFIFPAANRIYVGRSGQRPYQWIQMFTPVTDTYTLVYQWMCSIGDPPPYKTTAAKFQSYPPGGFKRIEDGWWDIWERDQDDAAMESQGVIANRSLEHMAPCDKGVALFRQLLKRSIDAVEQGKDPVAAVPPNDDIVMLESYKMMGIEDPTKIHNAELGEKLEVIPPYDLKDQEAKEKVPG